ncbi:hypothetical protein EsH8_XIV_000023 [Colletotrichum jinshuiense]
MLVVLKAGGAFLPIDVSHAVDRRARVNTQTSARVVLASTTFTSGLAAPGRRVIPVDPLLVESLDEDVQSSPTAQPEGVQISHGSFSSAMHHQPGLIGFGSKQVYDFLSYAFDLSIETVLMTLALGGCLCVPSATDPKDILMKSLTSLGVTMAHIVPGIVYFCRKDGQAKIRSHRVELGEVEHHSASTYVWNAMLELGEQFDLPRFSASWDRLARMVAILRTRIVQSPQLGLLQVVLNEQTRWHTANGLDKYLAEDETKPLVMVLLLVRVAVICLAFPAPSVFVLTMRYTLYDALSLSLMFDAAHHVCRYQTLVVVQPSHESVPEKSAKALGRWKDISGLEAFSTYALNLICSLGDGSIGIKAIFDDSIIDQSSIQRLLENLVLVISQLANVGEKVVLADIDALSAAGHESVWSRNGSVPLQSTIRDRREWIFTEARSTVIPTMVFNLPSSVDLQGFWAVWDDITRVFPILRTRIVQTEGGALAQVLVAEPISWTEGEDLRRYLAEDTTDSLVNTINLI